MNNREIFNYLKPDQNDQLSKMKGRDLRELFFWLDKYFLEMRSTLNLPNTLTLGIEIELEHTDIYDIRERIREVNLLHEWTVDEDDSLSAHGAEIKSPTFIDDSTRWSELQTICNLVADISIINDSCGSHVHVGSQVLGNNLENWLNFMELWSTYENIFFRFAYGEFLNARSFIEDYASPLKSHFEELLKSRHLSLENLMNELPRKKSMAINFHKSENYELIGDKNTIEFRLPNGTKNPIIWQNNINTFAKLLLSSIKPINKDIIKKRNAINKDKYNDLIWYQEIFLEQALELTDLIFTNNLDKLYFLRQYLKSFQNAYKTELTRSKVFTL